MSRGEDIYHGKKKLHIQAKQNKELICYFPSADVQSLLGKLGSECVAVSWNAKGKLLLHNTKVSHNQFLDLVAVQISA